MINPRPLLRPLAALALLAAFPAAGIAQSLVYSGREIVRETGFDPATSSWLRTLSGAQTFILVGPQENMLLSVETSPGSYVAQNVGVRPVSKFTLFLAGRVRSYSVATTLPTQVRWPDPVTGPNYDVEGGQYYVATRLDASGRVLNASLSEDPLGGPALSGAARLARPTRSSTALVYAPGLSRVVNRVDAGSLAGTLVQNGATAGLSTDIRESLRLNAVLTELVQNLDFPNAQAFIEGYLARLGYTKAP